MHYKGYTCNLSGVFKVENSKKLYSLEIYQDAIQIFKSDWIYEDEKRAFKDAKNMINKNRFDTEIIRKNTNKENLKNDVIYKNTQIKKFSNNIIIVSIILMIIKFVITAFGINELGEDFSVFGIFFVGLGIFFSLMMSYWGIFAKGGFELNDKQRKVYNIMWWVNLLSNKGPANPYYNHLPIKRARKGWYSSTALIALLFEVFIGIILIIVCVEMNSFNLLFYGIIATYVLLFINYIFSVIWEISNAKINGEDFPFKRVIEPILAIVAIVIFAYFYLKFTNPVYF